MKTYETKVATLWGKDFVDTVTEMGKQGWWLAAAESTEPGRKSVDVVFQRETPSEPETTNGG